MAKNSDGTISSTTVEVKVDATDVPLPGMAQGANAHMTDMLSYLYNSVSGGVQVRFSNDPSMAGAQYEPISSPKLDADMPERRDLHGLCAVHRRYGQ